MGRFSENSVPWDGMGWDGTGWDCPIPRGALIPTNKSFHVSFSVFNNILYRSVVGNKKEP